MQHSSEYHQEHIETLIQPFRVQLAGDFEKYKNHVYRVFLNCQLLDPDQYNYEKYALAAVFHDIGIWTNHTIDYLDPSVYQLKAYLEKQPESHRLEEVSLMIYWHHKVTPYSGAYQKTVEVFRKADWMDVSLGILSFGSDRRLGGKYRKDLPNKGFHIFLVRQIFRNFLRHPFNPLPMFRK